MNSTIAYSIVFFDPDKNHVRSGENIEYCQSEDHLIDLLDLYGQTRITVCICCEDEELVLTTLRKSTNIASIILCNQHHRYPYGISNFGRFIRSNSFNSNEYWQLDAHTDALNANDDRHTFFYIKSIIKKFLERQSYPTYDSTEEKRNKHN